LGFLYFTYNFSPKNGNKSNIINNLKRYDKTDKRLQIKNMREHFEVLNNLLEALIKDQGVTKDDKKYLKQLLYESKNRENKIKKEKC
jgi:ABC-type arginine transport system ATPase subunit